MENPTLSGSIQLSADTYVLNKDCIYAQIGNKAGKTNGGLAEGKMIRVMIIVKMLRELHARRNIHQWIPKEDYDVD